MSRHVLHLVDGTTRDVRVIALDRVTAEQHGAVASEETATELVHRWLWEADKRAGGTTASFSEWLAEVEGHEDVDDQADRPTPPAPGAG